MKPPRLLHFRVSHFNEKVRWALDFKGVSHIRTALVPGFHIPTARFHSGQNKVPIIIFEDLKLAGSNHILAELEKRYPSPPLFPASESDKKLVHEIQNYFDTKVAPEVRVLFWINYFDDAEQTRRVITDGAGSGTKAVFRAAFPFIKPVMRRNLGVYADKVQRARENLSSHFDHLEKQIGSSGYLVGGQFSAADICAASMLSALIRPPQFSYPLPEPQPAGLVKMRQEISNRKAFKWTMDMFSKHRGKSFEIKSER